MTELRRATAADLPFIQFLEDHFHLQGFIGFDNEIAHQTRLNSPDAAYYVIEADGQAAGFVILCGLANLNRNIELKRVAVKHPGEGTGREALRQVLALAFGEHQAHRVWLDVYTDNDRAQAVYRGLGFVEEGVMRECIWQFGRFRSQVLMSLLEDEYRAL